MSDPTAAERARRYRARRAAVTSRSSHGLGELVAVLVRVAEDIEALLESYPQPAGAVGIRDDFARHAVPRDVTTRHAAEGARVAPARTSAVSSTSGALETAAIPSRVTDPLVDVRARILEALAGRSPHTAAALADALAISTAEALAGLVALAGLGRVRRIAATEIDGRDRWQLVTESPSETIACSDYRAHQLAHRRDPASGRFRCYLCEPDGRAPEQTYPGDSVAGGLAT